MTPRIFIIGTRGSQLAMWQANFVKTLLQNRGFQATIKIIETQGDKIQHLSFDKMEGKGFFTKEIERELIAADIDIAVHSFKDLESRQPSGLVIASVPDKASSLDVLLIRNECIDANQQLSLKKGARIGTSAVRRKVQLKAISSDFELIDLRGNVPTRIKKLSEGNYDAIVLAKAGIERLNPDLEGITVRDLSIDEMVPAPAQGALALQVRKDDLESVAAAQSINLAKDHLFARAEKEVMRQMDGGCQLPLGVLCTGNIEGMEMHIAYAPDENTELLRFSVAGDHPTSLALKALAILKA